MTDVFKIKKLYQDKVGGPQWNSLCWNNGTARLVKSGSKDPFDTTLVTENRGNVSWNIDGKGQLLFNVATSGTPEPRFHFNNPSKYFFRDVECTFYMMRVKDTNVNWGGCCFGVRSGPDGHSVSSKYCDAHTYYQRIRNDSRVDTEKELKHSDSSVRSATCTWPSSTRFPFNQWIGYKSLTYNVGNTVKFELYRDLTGGLNGGTWQLMFQTTDSGGWAPPQSSPACSYARDFIPLQGGGVCILRNTGTSDARYKWMTVREIIPTKFEDSNEFIQIPKDVNFEYETFEGQCDCFSETCDSVNGCDSGSCSTQQSFDNHNEPTVENVNNSDSSDSDDNSDSSDSDDSSDSSDSESEVIDETSNASNASNASNVVGSGIDSWCTIV